MPAPRRLRLSRISPPILTAAICTVASVMASALTLAGSAEAAWSAPQKIATKQAFERPDLARDANGDAALVWHFEDDEEGPGTLNPVVPIEASTRIAGREWSAPQVLEPCCRTSLALAIDSRGSATVAWERFLGSRATVETLTHPLGASWSGASRISPGPANGYEPQLTFTAPGDELLGYTTVFESPFARGLRIERRVPRAGWRALPLAADVSGMAGDELRLAVARDGETIVAVSDHEEHRVQLVMLDRNGHPEGPIQSFASGGRGYATELDLVADRRGDAALVWRDTSARQRPVFIVTRRPGGRFAAPLRIAGGIGMEPVVAIDGAGRASVIFANQTGRNERPLEISRQSAGRRWSKPRALVQGGRFIAAQLGATQSGLLIAVWSDESARSIEAATTTPSGSWQAPTLLSAAGGGEPGLPILASLAIAGDGATAAWAVPGGFETSDYTP